MTNLDEVKDTFYEDLNGTISAVPKADKLMILGEFNAHSGRDHTSWEGVMEKQGVGKCNINGLLLESCITNYLLITNTVFPNETGRRRCTCAPNTDIYLITSSLGKGTGM